MASPSPGRRLRAKTSDLTDFFRTGHVSRARPADSDTDVPSPSPSSTPAFLSEPESEPRKLTSKIPFLGRQRKKSTQSDASTSASSAGPSNPRQSDAEVRHSTASKRGEPRPDVPAIPSADGPTDRPLPPLPSSSTNIPSPSLGSKIAAHFVPSKQKLLNLTPRKPPRSQSNEYTSDTLSPPASASRGPSIDSTSSEMRSTTPRPTQPTITVSLPPDNLEGYEGMFTLPNSSSGSDRKDPQLTPTQPIHFPTVPSSDSQIRQSDSDSTVKRRGSRTPADERSSSRASRTSRRHVSTPARQLGFDSTDAEDSEAVMSDTPKASPPMNTGSTPTAEKRRTLATMPYNFSEKAMSQPRSIMKNTSERSNRAPAFPPPPPTDPPALELPMLPSTPARKPTSSSLPLGSSVRRPRAQTLTSVHTSPIVPPPPSSLGTVPSRRTIKFSGGESALIPPAASLSKKVVEERTGKENFDIDTATPEQLRQALLLRNQQFDELASYLLKITEVHVAEKHALQKKVAALEQDATRRENEIKGLTWLVMNNRPGSSGSVGGNAAASKSDSALEDPQRQPQSGAKPSPSYSRASLAEDSGAESHQTASGAEESSYRESGSGTSGGESSLSSKARKVKRSHTLMSSFYRTSSTRGASGLGLFGAGEPGVLSTPSTPSTKRSSISSVGSSSSSSRSSLALTNLTPATTVSSLSAIPESASASASVPAKPPKPSQDPLVAAAILATESQRALATESQREKEERRASRVAHRVSTASSVNSITPSASASYSANLKRTRPPSIAQVLAQSPRMEHGRDRLRFSGTSGSASS